MFFSAGQLSIVFVCVTTMIVINYIASLFYVAYFIYVLSPRNSSNYQLQYYQRYHSYTLWFFRTVVTIVYTFFYFLSFHRAHGNSIERDDVLFREPHDNNFYIHL